MKSLFRNRITIGLLTILAITLTLSSCSNRNRKHSQEEEYYEEESYKMIGDALKSGEVRTGMTYEEIVEICGPADDVWEYNGVIRSATYYLGLGGTTLNFTDSGVFYEYSKSY